MTFRHILLNVGLILILIIILFLKFTKNDTELISYNVSNSNHAIPLHYDVKIKFDVDKNVFSGKCNIIILIYRPTKNITIMSSQIFNIVEIDLINMNGNQTINIEKCSYMNKISTFFAELSADTLSPGTYILKIIYVYTLLDKKYYFKSYYRDKEA